MRKYSVGTHIQPRVFSPEICIEMRQSEVVRDVVVVEADGRKVGRVDRDSVHCGCKLNGIVECG